MILRNGVDLIEIARIRAALDRYGERFLKRIFTSGEIEECADMADALAVCFAAKEAAVKALGTGIGLVGWREVETLHKKSGEPYLVLHGAAERKAKELGLTTWSLSLSHNQTQAIAVVVTVGD